ncbi:MAG: hypothetical protein VB066_03245 [Paludibacter sp.]|nr:hypothetical protein [Paludibacter sp.]
MPTTVFNAIPGLMYKFYMPDVPTLHARRTKFTCLMYKHNIADVQSLHRRCVFGKRLMFELT